MKKNAAASPEARFTCCTAQATSHRRCDSADAPPSIPQLFLATARRHPIGRNAPPADRGVIHYWVTRTSLERRRPVIGDSQRAH